MEGNQMKMRETLLVVMDALDTISAHEDDIEFVRTWIGKSKKAVQEALALPRRNCDVGTAEEQVKRYDKFCDIHDCRSDCPLFKADSCELAWAQMPYEAKEGGAE